MSSVLLISRIPPNNATTIEDHVKALVELSKFDVTNIDVNDPNISVEISKTNCIILHYSVIAYPYRGDHILNSFLRLQISLSGKPVLHMVQDEQRNILERFRYFESIGVKHVFSVASSDVFNLMYSVSQRNFTVSTLLTGYMPISLDSFQEIPWNKRTIDISYRARRLPKWYGHLGFTKSDISDQLNKIKVGKGLIVNASCEEDDRLYGQEWIDFLCNSKVAVGTESGSSTLDMDGRNFEEWQNRSNLGSFKAVEPIVANYAAISPRIFEYAAAKCLLALTPGEYSGILLPGVHYFELLPDLSNFKDLLVLMNDQDERERMINSSFQHLISSRKFGYEHMVNQVDFWVGKFLGNLEYKSTSKVEILKVEEEKAPSEQQKNLQFLKKISKVPAILMRSIKRIIFEWGISRRGVIRVILRTVFRMLIFIWSRKFFRFLRILMSVNFQLSGEFKKTFAVTKSFITSTRLIPELEFVKAEAQSLALENCNLSVRQTNSGLWVSWPESLQEDNFLKEHPKLDSLQFPGSEGVWFTRSDYSETHKPVHLSSLSSYYKKNKQKTIKLIQIFCGSDSV